MWSLTGNERIVEALARSLREGRASHAYLFTGPVGIGKSTLAMNLAQALNCTGAEPPCGSCRQCQRIAGGKHADVLTIALKSSESGEVRTGILLDQIKDVQQSASLRPFEGLARVFIIDGADMLTGEAANRMLKTLEEPPDSVYFILLAADVSRVLPTVVSRCRACDLRPVPSGKITEMLVAKHNVAQDRAALLARLASGRPGWAIAATKDEAVLIERDEALNEVTHVLFQSISERLSLAGRLAGAFARDRGDALEWLTLLEQWWRDVMLVKTGHAELAVNADREAALRESADALTVEAIAEALRQIQDARMHLDANVNARLAFDVMMLRLPSAKQTVAAA
ncbi:MAG: DNA polymerase III subunit delta' [Chloroflexi bacterium]|nr:DNA polymerase III subunit delta' [Chloroflexota bacterium]